MWLAERVSGAVLTLAEACAAGSCAGRDRHNFEKLSHMALGDQPVVGVGNGLGVGGALVTKCLSAKANSHC